MGWVSIDGIIEADHCQRARQNEVDAARKTLDRAGATPSQPGAA